jgi:DNA-binding XRE family transcriptional regulator
MGAKYCDGSKKVNLTWRQLPYAVFVGKRTFESGIGGWNCASCGENTFDGRAIEKFERDVAKWFIEQGYESPTELRFVCKVTGLRALDLGRLLGVSEETVSHWETGNHAVDIATRNAVASLVSDALRGTNTTREQLRALRTPARSMKIRLGRGKAA